MIIVPAGTVKYQPGQLTRWMQRHRLLGVALLVTHQDLPCNRYNAVIMATQSLQDVQLATNDGRKLKPILIDFFESFEFKMQELFSAMKTEFHKNSKFRR